MHNSKQIKIGEVYLMYFSGRGSVQGGWRPGLVFQNNIGNAFSPNVVALPLTSCLKKTTQPTHVIVQSSDTGLRMDSMVLCENPECMPQSMIGEYITTLPEKYMREVSMASILASAAISYLDPDELVLLWVKAVGLNNRQVA